MHLALAEAGSLAADFKSEAEGVAIAQTMRDVSPDLMDIITESSFLGEAEYIFRLAGPTGIYGGTLEVFRNMIAQHVLGLGHPNYSAPATRKS